MARLLPRLDLPDDFHDWRDEAKESYWDSNVQLEQLSNALVDEYDLPERDGIPYLNKEQLAALVRELDTSEYGGQR